MQIRLKQEAIAPRARFRPRKWMIVLAICGASAAFFFVFKKPSSNGAAAPEDAIASTAIRAATIAEESKDPFAGLTSPAPPTPQAASASTGAASASLRATVETPAPRQQATSTEPASIPAQDQDVASLANAPIPVSQPQAAPTESSQAFAPQTELVAIAQPEPDAAAQKEPISQRYPETNPGIEQPLSASASRVVERLPQSMPLTAAQSPAPPASALQATSQVAAAPPAPRMLTHTIRDGDTLASLAQRFLGSADRAQILYDANRDVLASMDILPIGATLRIPSSDTFGWLSAKAAQPGLSMSPTELSPATAPALPASQQKTHRVRRGDSLASISREHYGAPFRAREIYSLNRARLARPDRLPQGVVLVLP